MTLDFYDRLPDAREEALDCGMLDGDTLDEIAWQHQVCPFELVIQLIPWCHVVVADYNYVFDPLVRLPHFSQSHNAILLLIDEAHNLLDRSRLMFSAEINRQVIRQEIIDCRHTHPMIAHALERVSKQLLLQVNTLEDTSDFTKRPSAALLRAISQAIEAIMVAAGDSSILHDTSFELFKVLCRFTVIAELYSDSHVCLYETTSAKRFKSIKMSLSCLDASYFLAKQFELVGASVLFSATLRPATFYRDTLGLPNTTTYLQLGNPFREEQSYQAIVDWVDTRYGKRESSCSLLVTLIYEITSQRQGSYLIFFASYAYLHQVQSAFTQTYPDINVWNQAEDQTVAERQSQLDELKQGGHRLGFAILGGVFGEGIDYVGDALIGVIVVGTGLPSVDQRVEKLIDHYNKRFVSGYDYACRYPAVIRILQSAGRLIRSESDTGIIVLIDDRFKSSFYQRLYPSHWQVDCPSSKGQLLERVRNFWCGVEA